MHAVATFLTVVVALEHLAFLVLEMFLWTKPVGLKVFGQTIEQAVASAQLAKNQGLYNGFLSAALLLGAAVGNKQVCIFTLSCVVIAGIFGAVTANRKIFWIQAMPGLLAIATVLLL